MPTQLMSVLLLASSALTFAEEDPWMRAPDGYVWPDDVAAQLEEDAETLFGDLPPPVRAYLVDQYSPESPPKRVSVRRADLNGDGELEWFLDRPELGGTGGRAYDILDISGESARSIGGLLGGFRLCIAAPNEKWLRIECSSRAGGSHYTRYLLQYIGGEFKTVRNEDHDYLQQKVTIRKLEESATGSKNQGEQGVAPQSATRSDSDSEGGDKPQPDSESRSR